MIPSILVIGYNTYERKQIKNEKIQINQEISLTDINSTLPAKILTIGDSHADHLAYFLNHVGAQEGWKADIFNNSNVITQV